MPVRVNVPIIRLALILVPLLAVVGVGAALALFSASTAMPGNAFTLDTLNAPTSATATGGATVSVGWTATTDTYASGHRVLRSAVSGGPYSQVGEVTPRTTTTFVDSPAAGAYFYVVRAYHQNWESGNGNEVAASCCTVSNTGLRSPTAQAADSGGDGNGFEDNPANGFALDGSQARDDSSGTGTGTTCSSTGKDRHRYYNYGLSIPSNASIVGIEVRLDASVNNPTGTRFMCVEISWDAGATWTTAKSTGNMTNSIAAYTLGSSSDAWGRVWSVTNDFTNANFRVRITNVSNDSSQRFQLDRVAVRATYAAP